MQQCEIIRQVEKSSQFLPGADSGGGAPGAPPPLKKKERERERERGGGGERKQGGNDTFNKRKNVCRSICNIFLTFSDRLLNAT